MTFFPMHMGERFFACNLKHAQEIVSRDIKHISCELLLSSKSEDKPPLIRHLQDLLRTNNLHTTVHCCLTFSCSNGSEVSRVVHCNAEEIKKKDYQCVLQELQTFRISVS